MIRVGVFTYSGVLSNPLSELKASLILFRLLFIRTLLSSMDSDLEAFSHNPTDGSFTALAFQPTVLPII